jgi:hypothetical protein
MKRGPALAGSALLFFLLALSPAALAQRVLLLRPPNDDPTLYEAFSRVRAELELQDFEVSILDGNGGSVDPITLEDEARKAGAFAGIALTRRKNGAIADIAIADRVTGKISQRRLSIDTENDAPTLLAVRAVDLLRVSLRELDPDEPPPDDVVGVEQGPPPDEVRAFARAASPFELRAGVFSLGPGSALGAAYGGTVGLYFRPAPAPAVALGISVAGPLIGAGYSADGGTATIRQELALLRGFWNLLPDSSWELGPALGVGAYHLAASSEVEPPLVAESDEVWSFAASAGVDAELFLTDALSLNAGLSVLFLTPRPAVAIAGPTSDAASPLLAGTFGLGVAF